MQSAAAGKAAPVLALSAALAFAIALAGCGTQAQEGAGMPPPPEVSVATVLSKPVRQWDGFTGRVAAVETVELRPRVSGYVQRVAYDEGQEVAKGEPDQGSCRPQQERQQGDGGQAPQGHGRLRGWEWRIG